MCGLSEYEQGISQGKLPAAQNGSHSVEGGWFSKNINVGWFLLVLNISSIFQKYRKCRRHFNPLETFCRKCRDTMKVSRHVHCVARNWQSVAGRCIVSPC
jgi:hypothetical protein